MSEQRYTVLEHIDAGGMAEVFKANSSSVKGFDKLVAIKRILPSLTKNERFVRMFLDEAKVSLFLNHTNVVQVFDLVYAEHTYLIIMEYVNGVNLKKLIENIPQIPIQCAVYIAIEMSKGLAHAHNKCDRDGNSLGIVHRDVSPANIMVSVEGEVKVTDFGLAKARDQVEKTDPGVVKGKFGYLSPEAAYGREVDRRTDIFAVGILLWEMLTGERLFLGDTDLDTLKQVRKNKVKPAATLRPDVPSSLDQILRKALATDPDRRYQYIEEMIRDLTKFMFSYGQPVSSLDIAELVLQLQKQSRPVVRTTEDRVLERELQEVVNKFVSLEKIMSESEDLDRYMAEVYGSMESSEPSQHGASGEVNFEDPALWADLGIDEAELGINSLSEAKKDGDDKMWQQRPLSGLSQVSHMLDGRENADETEESPRSDSDSFVSKRKESRTLEERTLPDDNRLRRDVTTSEDEIRTLEMRRKKQQTLQPSLKNEQPLQTASEQIPARHEPRSKMAKSNNDEKQGRGMMIVIVVLLVLAILGVLAFMLLK